MKEIKNIKVDIPEGYEIDKEASSFENIVFKRKEPYLPKSWGELENVSGFYVNSSSNLHYSGGPESLSGHRNRFATREQAEASIAMAQLSQLMKIYNEGWEPKWSDEYECKYVIYYHRENIITSTSNSSRCFLSFKSSDLRDLFLENFRDLIEKAKPLL